MAASFPAGSSRPAVLFAVPILGKAGQSRFEYFAGFLLQEIPAAVPGRGPASVLP